MDEKDKLHEASSDLESTDNKTAEAPKKPEKPKQQAGKAKPEPKPESAAESETEVAAENETEAVAEVTGEVVVGKRTIKLQMAAFEGIEVHQGMRTFVTVIAGAAATVGDNKVNLGETIEVTEDVQASCTSFSQIEIKWVI